MARPVCGAAVQLIKDNEGYSACIYADPDGHETIGWGHKLTPGDKITPPITPAQGLFILAQDIAIVAYLVSQATSGVVLTDNQFGALVSFVFNVGITNFTRSTMLQMLRGGQLLGASEQFGRWVFGTVGGQKVVLPGLVTRREAEKNLFLEK